MAGFFSLGSATYNTQQQDPTTNINSDPNFTGSSSWLLYGTTYNPHHHPSTAAKDQDFDLLQQQAPDARNLLARAGGASMGGDDGGNSINFIDESTWGSAGFMMVGHGGVSNGGGSCRDCGNQAKKDCPHLRCRTCCKSRGFHCQTHVKSTWVAAAKRRERQQCLPDTRQEHDLRRRVLPTTKRTKSVQDDENPNLAYPTDTATAIAYNSSSGLDRFPSEVTTQADFRCVRVSSIDETDDQFAYQAAVNIHGHSFKGILYDQGPESHYMGGDTSSGGSAGIPHLSLPSISPGNPTATANYVGHSLYASLGGNDYLTSTQFFHQISRD